MHVIWQEILTHIVGFAIILALLKRYLWGPVLEVLDARSAKVRHELDKAMQTREQMEQAKADYEQHLAQIETEARQKTQEAITQGKRIAEEIHEEARKRAEALLDKAQEGISLEIDKAKIHLRDEITQLVMEATSRLLHERVDDKKDRQLIQQMLDEMEQAA